MVVLLMNYQLQYSSNITSHSLEIFRRVMNAHRADLLIEVETEATTQSCAIVSRLTIVSREAKKKQAVRNKRVSYLQVALL